MRILVTIANYGTKNRAFLDTLLAEYRQMRFDVTLVIHTEEPRDFGLDVENIVGYPTENPRGLPFAHRAVMADRVDDFDLFIYSEDDTLITEAHIDAFLRADRVLPDDHVAGFLRYEEHPDGRRNYCSIHSHYYWDPSTVCRYGDQVFCEFTNFHAASYLLTQDHLRRVIGSGDYEPVPTQGLYDMMAWAASGPFLTGAIKRVVCVSAIDDFMLHHLPDLYLDRLGIDRTQLDAQVAAIESLAVEPAPSRLFETTTKLDNDRWDRHAFGGLTPQLASLLGATVRSVITVGAGSGQLETELMDRGKEVVAVPLDAVFSSMLVTRGVPVTSSTWPVPEEDLGDRRFEAVVLLDVLNHVPDPVMFLKAARDLATSDGTVIVGVPNLLHTQLDQRAGRSWSGGDHRPTFEHDRLHDTNRTVVFNWCAAAGLRPRRVEPKISERLERVPLPRALSDRVASYLFVAADVTDEPRFS